MINQSVCQVQQYPQINIELFRKCQNQLFQMKLNSVILAIWNKMNPRN